MSKFKDVVEITNSRKRICFFAPNLEGGGAERVISILAARFSESAYEVDLVLANAAGPYLNDIPDSVEVINFKCKKMILTLPKIIKYLRTQQPDILFTSHMHVSTIALYAVKLSFIKTRVFVRQPTMLMPSSRKRSWTSKLRQKLFLMASKSAYRIIVTSKSMSKEFQNLSGLSSDKIVIIYNPVPIQTIEKKSLEILEHPWFKDGELPVILAVGRLITVKDFRTLVKAFCITHNKIPTRLLILGEGPLRAEIEELIEKLGVKDLVQMPGFVSNPYQYMKHSQVFVLSSLWEGFPNSMVEAMACGTAIVSTDCDGGASEVLEFGKWGKIVPIENEQKMAEAIVETLSMENLPNVVERVTEFSVDHIFKKYDEIFDS